MWFSKALRMLRGVIGSERSPDEAEPLANPARFQGGDGFRMVNLDADPGTIVRWLTSKKLPSQGILNHTIVTPQDLFKPIISLSLLPTECPFEKEELIEFVRRHERVLRGGGLDLLTDFVDDVGQIDDPELRRNGRNIMAVMNSVVPQVQLILAGRADQVDVRSETLELLIQILASQVKAGIRTHPQAVAYLTTPAYRNKIGPATLRPMLMDFARGCADEEAPDSERLLLITEAAILGHETATIMAGMELIRNLPARIAVDRTVRDDLLSRCDSVSAGDRLDSDGRSFLLEVRSRFYTEVADEDL